MLVRQEEAITCATDDWLSNTQAAAQHLHQPDDDHDGKEGGGVIHTDSSLVSEREE